MKQLFFALLTVSLAHPIAVFADEPADRAIRFEVTDPRPLITWTIDSTLQVRAVRISHADVPHFGWEVQVVEGAASASSKNVLRGRSFSGGPHPSDVLAWLSREQYFPDYRTLPVPGYPYELRIRLIDCRTDLVGDTVGFVSGSVEVSWRRLDLADRGGSPTRLKRSAAGS